MSRLTSRPVVGDSRRRIHPLVSTAARRPAAMEHPLARMVVPLPVAMEVMPAMAANRRTRNTDTVLLPRHIRDNCRRTTRVMELHRLDTTNHLRVEAGVSIRGSIVTKRVRRI